MATKATLLAALDGSGQEHILADYDDLTVAEQSELAAQVISFSNAQWKHMNSMLRDSLEHLNASNRSAGTAVAAAGAPLITPPPAATIFNLPKLLAANSAELESIHAAGMHVIARGEGAVLLMAGGSGTRLGVTIPKGLFHCDLLASGRSLFEYHCSRVRKMEQMAAAFEKRSQQGAQPTSTACRGLLPVLVMTSDQNDAATQAFFREHGYFGLLPDQVIFFRQTSLPCYSEKTGKVLMEARGKMCVAPGGNGGLYESLERTPAAPSAAAASRAHSTSELSVLAQLEARGVRYVQIFSVDNILAKLGDPYFFGIAAKRQAEVVVKTVPKVSAEERVGVFALKDGEWGVVEYTEIGAERAMQRDDVSGELAYNCGNIASHCCSVEFLKLAAKDMKTSTFYHAARKNIATVGGIASAIKMEAFIFDEFKLAKLVPTRPKDADLPDAFQIMQVDRCAEFAPIKNAEGAATDTATTAAQLVLNLHSKWVAEAIVASPEQLEAGEEAYAVHDRATALQRLRDGLCKWEISPLVSYEGEGLAALAPQLIRRSLTGEGVLSLEETTQSRANM
ncbi:putative UDP-N-acetylglucosamine pyrophosphorylase [Leptomonas seymouri]|uniref:UDP-N-acetylglucosamine diphosphorylase n=1 Tax=Leptomonas seymouri TaxID=5684 RepID=A0A0N1PG62_LEPSE|nr:putative UDP-N-acetylglucosamine pyrophosphorylase [Leptomonas seymouri]|eukprot:KPI89851.1 putative UDP-N-acetylglucosamine pyrophosphorylase [Leptomonas seymouri]